MIYTEQVIDWTARGYFRFPVSDESLRIDEKYQREWDEFAASLSYLKAGSFGRDANLWAACRAAKSWQVSGAYAYLIGHTASLEFFQGLHPLVSSTADPGASVDAAECLAHAGLLSGVLPLVKFVDTYRHLGEFEDAYWSIVFLLDDGKWPIPKMAPKTLESDDVFDDFAERVTRRVDELQARFGTESNRILQGELLSVTGLIKKIRESAEGSVRFDHKLRQIFEAMTGVDCTDFFRDHRADSLGINAILDQFEEDGDPDRYAPGKRYFFGYPVPDQLPSA